MNTSSRVTWCGVAGWPGASSTRHTLVSVEPQFGVANEVKRAPSKTCVGDEAREELAYSLLWEYGQLH